MKTIAQCHLLKAVSQEGLSTGGLCSVQNRADRYAICLSNVTLFLSSHPMTLLVFGFLLPPVWFGTLEPGGEPALLIFKQHGVELHGLRSKPSRQKKKAVVRVLCYLYSTPQLPFEAAVCRHPLTLKRNTWNFSVSQFLNGSFRWYRAWNQDWISSLETFLRCLFPHQSLHKALL